MKSLVEFKSAGVLLYMHLHSRVLHFFSFISLFPIDLLLPTHLNTLQTKASDIPILIRLYHNSWSCYGGLDNVRQLWGRTSEMQKHFFARFMSPLSLDSNFIVGKLITRCIYTLRCFCVCCIFQTDFELNCERCKITIIFSIRFAPPLF